MESLKVASLKLSTEEHSGLLKPVSLKVADAVVALSAEDLRQREAIVRRRFVRLRAFVSRVFSLVQSAKSDGSVNSELQLCEWLALANVILSIHCESQRMNLLRVLLDATVNCTLCDKLEQSQELVCKVRSLMEEVSLCTQRSSPLLTSLVAPIRGANAVAALNDFVRAFGYADTSNPQSLLEILQFMAATFDGANDTDEDKKQMEADSKSKSADVPIISSTAAKQCERPRVEFSEEYSATIGQTALDAKTRIKPRVEFSKEYSATIGALESSGSVHSETGPKEEKHEADDELAVLSSAVRSTDDVSVAETGTGEFDTYGESEFDCSTEDEDDSEFDDECHLDSDEETVGDCETETGSKKRTGVRKKKKKKAMRDLMGSQFAAEIESVLRQFATDSEIKSHSTLDNNAAVTRFVSFFANACVQLTNALWQECTHHSDGAAVGEGHAEGGEEEEVKSDAMAEGCKKERKRKALLYDSVMVYTKQRDRSHLHALCTDWKSALQQAISEQTMSAEFCSGPFRMGKLNPVRVVFGGKLAGDREAIDLMGQLLVECGGGKTVPYLTVSLRLCRPFSGHFFGEGVAVGSAEVGEGEEDGEDGSVFADVTLNDLSHSRKLTSDDLQCLTAVLRYAATMYHSCLCPYALGDCLSMLNFLRLLAVDYVSDATQRNAEKEKSQSKIADALHRKYSLRLPKVKRVNEWFQLKAETGASFEQKVILSELKTIVETAAAHCVENTKGKCFRKRKAAARGSGKRRRRGKQARAEDYEHVADTRFAVESQQFIINGRLIRRFKKYSRRLHKFGCEQPCLVFHCTNPRNVQSIASEGLKAAGDWLEDVGATLQCAHGDVWGSGIYTTQDLTLARHYGGEDIFKRQQVLVCLFNPGRVHRVTKCDTECIHNGRRTHLEGGKLVYRYSCGANTHVTADGRQIVAAHSGQLCPVSLLTYRSSLSPLSADISLHSLALTDYMKCMRSAYLWDPMHNWIARISQKCEGKVAKAIEASAAIVRMTPLCHISSDAKEAIGLKPGDRLHDSLWTAAISGEWLAAANIPRTAVHLHLLVDGSDAMTVAHTYENRVLPLCADLMRDLQPIKTHAYLFADSVRKYANIATPSVFKSDESLQSAERGGVNQKRSGRKLLEALRLCVDSILDAHIRERNAMKLDSFDIADDKLYSDWLPHDLTPFNKDREIRTARQLCHSLVNACVTQAHVIAVRKHRAKKSQPTYKSSAISSKVTMLQKQAKREESRISKLNGSVHVIVLFVGGRDTSRIDSDKLLKEYNLLLTANARSGLKIIVKPVLIGAVATDRIVSGEIVKIKNKVQTVRVFERNPLYCAQPRRVLNTVSKQLRSDLTSMALTSSLEVEVESSEHVLDEGFMCSVLSTPKWTVQTRASQSQLAMLDSANGSAAVRRTGAAEPLVLFFRGKPPRTLWVNSVPASVRIEGDAKEVDSCSVKATAVMSPSLTRGTLKAVQSLVTDLRLCAIEGVSKRSTVSGALKLLSRIVSALKTHSANPSALSKMSPVARMAQMKAVKRLVHDIEAILSEIDFAYQSSLAADTSLFGSDVSGTMGAAALVGKPKIAWLRNVKQMKFGRAALKRVAKLDGSRSLIRPKQLLSELSHVKQEYLSKSALQIADEMDEMECEFGSEGLPVARNWLWKSALSMRTSFELFEDMLASVDSMYSLSASLVDALYCFALCGVALRVRRSEAATVDPWQIRVSYVGHCHLDSAACMCALDSAIAIVEHRANGFVSYMDQNSERKGALALAAANGDDIKEELSVSSSATADDLSATTVMTDSSSLQPETKAQSLSLQTRKEKVTDVCVLLDRSKHECMPQWTALQKRLLKSRLYRVYLASVFTRNPSLHVGGQRSALLVSVFCQSVAQIFARDWRTIKKLWKTKADFFSTSTVGAQLRREVKHEIGTALNALYTLRQVLAEYECEEWRATIAKLKQSGTRPGVYMTASISDRVSSVCKLLAALCVFSEDSDGLFEEHCKLSARSGVSKEKIAKCQLSRIGIAMIAESTARECRIYVEKSQQRMWKRLMAALGISQSSVPSKHSVEYHLDNTDASADECTRDFDYAKAERHSGRFFQKQAATNCSPQCIVACLGFARALFDFRRKQQTAAKEAAVDAVFSDDSLVASATGSVAANNVFEQLTAASGSEELVEFLFWRFAKRRISMARFIGDFLPTAERSAVQIALFCQGLRYFKSAARREGVGLPELCEPMPVIADIAAGVRRHILERKVAVLASQIRADLTMQKQLRKRTILLAEQRLFAIAHFPPNAPRVFTAAMVCSLNYKRPASDRLELTASGLLKHHCCFRKCPKYLHNCSTENDAVLDTRHGLFRHLKYYWVPEPMGYVPGVHLCANAFVKRHLTNDVLSHEIPRKQFVSRFQTHFRHMRGRLLVDRRRYEWQKTFDAYSEAYLMSFVELYKKQSWVI